MFNKQATTGRQDQYGPNANSRGCGGVFGKKFGGRFGSFFGDKAAPWMDALNGHFGNRKAANIEETDSSFIIALYAAGLNKNQFSVSATGDVLTIRYDAGENTSNTQYAHQEYQPQSFERSFQLNGKVLTDNISATYSDGVLKVALPKNPDTNKPAQEVKVD